MSTEQYTHRVFIADGQPMLVYGLSHYLERHGIRTVGQASNVQDLLARFWDEQPDVILLDVLLPETAEDSSPRGPALALIERVLKVEPSARLLIYSARNTLESLTDAYQTGALGYLTKDRHPDQILAAIHSVAQGQHWFMNGYAEKIAVFRTTLPDPRRLLTPRELEIFKMLARGKTGDDIAAQLKIGRRSVHNRGQVIRSKLNIERAEFTDLALHYGLLDV